MPRGAILRNFAYRFKNMVTNPLFVVVDPIYHTIHAAGMSKVTPKESKLVRSSLLYFFFKMVIFVRLVNWFLGVSYQGDYFYQLVCTFLMIMQLSQADNSSF